MKNIVPYTNSFLAFIKGSDEPIELSEENGDNLGKVLGHKDCPPFVKINGGYYNRFEIARVVPFKKRDKNSSEDDQYHNDLLRKLEEKKRKIYTEREI